MQATPKAVLLSVAVAALIASCGPSGGIQPITKTREVSGPREQPIVAVTSAERFGYRQEPAHAEPESPHAAAPSADLAWDDPPGWQRKPAGGMRIADFALGPEGEIECYIIRLRGDGGGLVANINRWRGQMGQEPLTDEEIASLPQIEVLGEPSTLVEIAGDYTGMTGNAQPGYMMRALVCILNDVSYFVKMVGPQEIVRAEAENFRAFCQSLRFDGDTAA